MYKLPDMPVPTSGDYQEHQLHHYDGSTRTVYTTQKETFFPEGYLITSRTDLKGYITHANDAFVVMSGWTREELIGAPHYILRHPDLPRAAFKSLWDDVQAGKKWNGYVKNLRKDGGFYWVYATVLPNIRNGQVMGYTSIRRQPSRSKIAELSGIYREMIQEEQKNA